MFFLPPNMCPLTEPNTCPAPTDDTLADNDWFIPLAFMSQQIVMLIGLYIVMRNHVRDLNTLGQPAQPAFQPPAQQPLPPARRQNQPVIGMDSLASNATTEFNFPQ